MIKTNYALGPAASEAFQTVLSIAVTPGMRAVHAAVFGKWCSQNRGQILIHLEPADGLTIGTSAVTGRAFTSIGINQVAGPGIEAAELTGAPNMDDDCFAGFLDGVVEVLTAGTLKLVAGAPGASGDAAPSDIMLIQLASLTAD